MHAGLKIAAIPMLAVEEQSVHGGSPSAPAELYAAWSNGSDFSLPGYFLHPIEGKASFWAQPKSRLIA